MSYDTGNFLKDFNLSQFSDDPFWRNLLLSDSKNRQFSGCIHVAILSKEYLTKILSKEKTIESRFSIHRRIPYNAITQGDIILFKLSGGPILGIGFAHSVHFYTLTSDVLANIRTKFDEELQIKDEGFWEERKNANYATLIKLDHVRTIEPTPFPKRDSRAWVILSKQINLPLAHL